MFLLLQFAKLTSMLNVTERGRTVFNEQRTESIGIRLTPSEKLRLLQAARGTKYKGNITRLARDLLAGVINDKVAPYPAKSEKSDLVNATN